MENILLALFEFRDNIKLFHFQTKSYAAHKASDELEKTVFEALDTFMEETQGRKKTRVKTVEGTVNIRSHTKDIVPYVQTFAAYLDTLLGQMPDGAASGALDDIVSAIDKFVYLTSFE